jgi:type IV pilus assembly protein PilW
MTTSTAHRGLTLLELLISLAISVVVISTAMAMLLVQNSTLQKQSGVGNAMSQNQTANDTIAAAIRLAGTGIEPWMAFDFDFYDCTFGASGTTSINESANCKNKVRDSINAPDELVISYRDPAYSTNWVQAGNIAGDTRAGCFGVGDNGFFAGKVWPITATGANSATLVLKPGDTVYRGQVLQLACSDGTTYTYATVSSANQSCAPPPPTGNNTACCAGVQVTFYNPGLANNPFHQPQYLAANCYSNGRARAYSVKRQRFFVYRDTSTTFRRPYLMLDQGLDLNGDGLLNDLDLLPIAADVEDLQVAYVLDQVGVKALNDLGTGQAPNGYVGSGGNAAYFKDSNQNGIWGDDVGTDGGTGVQEQLSELLTAGSPAALTFALANSTFQGGALAPCAPYASQTLYQYPCLWGLTATETAKANSIPAYRWTAWPGNISNVKLGIIARAAAASAPGDRTSETLLIPALFNRPQQNSGAYASFYAATQPDGFKRVVTLSSVRPVNMSTIAPFWN